jgi:methionyl-tRNA synthetase
MTEISIETLSQVEIRIGTITAVSIPEWSKKLLQLEVDFGPEIGQRTIFSGIKQWYQPAELLGLQAPFVVNLAPKKMGEALSHGMMMMADGEQPILLHPAKQLPAGTLIR